MQAGVGSEPSNRKTSTQDKTIAGRVAPLVEMFYRVFVEACGVQAREPQLCKHLPSWSNNIALRFGKTIFKSALALAPRDRFEARDYGRMVGVLMRGAVFTLKEMKPLLQREGLWDLSEQQEGDLNQLAGMNLVFQIASEIFARDIRTEKQLVKALENQGEKWANNLVEQTKQAMLYLWGQSVEQQHQFLSGVPEGFVLFLDSEGNFAGDRRRTEIYLYLLVFWPEIVEMQQADPPKTRKELLEWLERQGSTREKQVQFFEDEQRFYDLCDDIGLVMKARGRPKE